MQTDTHNTVFQQALAFVNYTNQHLFLTGKAGTGKTTFLKYIREHCLKKMAIVAPTGVAAINAGGVTIHSFFQLPFGMYLPTAKTVWGGEYQQVHNKNQLLGKLRFQKAKRELIQELDLLVIDEISMVRADVMDAIDAVLRSVRRKPHLPFGGVQLLLIGDLFQLPPVVKENERELLSGFYNSPFFFDSLAIKEAEPIFIELNKIYRQKDESFIHILNQIRNNTCDYDDLEALHLHYKPHFRPYPDEGYITLTTHNYQADSLNQEELEKLPGSLFKMEAIIAKEFPENAYPVDKSLYLKVGAQIMFIKNEKGEKRRYYNGKIATISRIEEGEVAVRFGQEEEELVLEKETWRNIRYQYHKESDEIKEEELGTFQQYPIRLAWAVTIHKSQGLTFDKAIINAGKAFAPGQVYVALSRLTNLQGLVLMSRINTDAIMTDDRVVAFTQTKLTEDQIQETLRRSQLIYAEQSLLDAFAWEKLVANFSELIESYAGRALPEKEQAEKWARQTYESVLEQQTTAKKFIVFLQKNLQSGRPDYEQVDLRMQAAKPWFEEQIESVISSLQQHITKMKPKAKTKKYLVDLKELLLLFERKKSQIVHAPAITKGLSESRALSELMDAVHRVQFPVASLSSTITTTTKAPAVSSKEISLEMFQSGKTIAEIAEERNLVWSTIEGHLASFVSSGEIKITDLMSLDTYEQIKEALAQQTEPGTTALKKALPEHISYGAIRAVMALHSPVSKGEKSSNKNL